MPAADLVLKNARVITVDPRQPTAELVAIEGDKIQLIADNASLDSVIGAKTKVIDCEGKTLVPGFNDAHCHLFSLVRDSLTLDLSPASVKSIADIKAAIKRKAENTPKGQWIIGHNYNDFYLAEKRHPNRWDIDEVAPDHPVVLSHRSLHACVVNSLALSLAGITRETPEPPGAMFDRDAKTGEPTGIMYEMLGYIRHKVMPPLSDDELTEGMKAANHFYLSQGITSIQEATITNDLDRWQIYRRFTNNGVFKTRLSMMFGFDAIQQFGEAGLNFGVGDNQMRLGGVKIILQEATGQMSPSQAELEHQVIEAHRAGFQVAAHAVQTSTVDAIITALERANEQSPITERRHRIEHCSECTNHLLERLAKLPVMVVTQPPFIHYSGDRYLANVQADVQQTLYRIKSFMNKGLMVAASSDSPVVSANPLIGIYGAVTRKTQAGKLLLAEEAITPAQALALYTMNAAYASFEENIKGSITPGKLADLVLLSDDPTTVPSEQIKDIKVEMTMVGGKVVWEG